MYEKADKKARAKAEEEEIERKVEEADAKRKAELLERIEYRQKLAEVKRAEYEAEKAKPHSFMGDIVRTVAYGEAAKRALGGINRRTGTVKKIATLGGPIGMNERTKQYYAGGVPHSFYTGKPLPVTGQPHGMPARIPATPSPVPLPRPIAPTSTPMPQTYIPTSMRTLNMPGMPRSQADVDLSALRNPAQSVMSRPMGMSKAMVLPKPTSRPQPQPTPRMVAQAAPPVELKSGEQLVSEWNDNVWFWKLTEGRSVQGTGVYLTRTANGLYRLVGRDPNDDEQLSRLVGKNPPRPGQKFGPMRRHKGMA